MLSVRRLIILIGLLIVGLATLYFQRSRPAPKPRAVVLDEIDAELGGLTAKGFAGSILIAGGGDILLSKGYGLADRSTGRAIDPSTGFDIGSLVKVFTATAILTLEQDGKLQGNDSISRFLDVPDDKRAITVDMLLQHTSGLPDIVNSRSVPIDYTPEYDYEPVSRDEIVRRAMRAKLISPPGAKEQYSNLGYSLLGVIIEQASGKPYEDYLRQRIFVPAGMDRTGYISPGWKQDELAVGYVDGNPWGTPRDHPWLADGPSWNLRANGGMLSNPGDLYKWILALDSPNVFPPTLKNRLYELMVHKNRRGTRTMGPAGSNGIFDAVYLWYLDEHTAYIMMTSTDAYRAEKMVGKIAGQILNAR